MRKPFKTVVIKTANLFTQKKVTGNCAEIDFHRNGYIDITFDIYSNSITVNNYCGVSVDNGSTYYFFPTLKGQKSNEAFLNRFINPLEDSPEKSILLSKINYHKR